MNFEVLPFESGLAFWLAMAATLFVGVLLFVHFRRKEYL